MKSFHLSQSHAGGYYSVEDIDAFKAEFKVKLLVVAFMMMVYMVYVPTSGLCVLMSHIYIYICNETLFDNLIIMVLY
jgi:hypothetical protein